ncbi:MAG: WXG100 family type VII secretion target [Solobacterium sp.]|nr:WXG100 family type VII secretion target [Solobacterium sp.]
MAMINISMNEVSDTAGKIRNLNQMMYEELNEMKREMNSLNGSWISDASEEIRNRFNQFSLRFDNQKEVIDSYAKYLDMTVSSYETLEAAVQNNASTMQY